MEKELFIEKITTRFGDKILRTEIIKQNRILVDIDKHAILEIVDYLHNGIQFRFIIASAFHTKAGFEILYHFSDDKAGNIANFHVVLPQENPEIESLTQCFIAADWIEREMHELFGITFLNHTNPGKLLSEGNWAEGVYPYRKDFTK
ncbi:MULTISPECIES: NADH-quinone oxidoreductase subunit C [unclassified Saccharicrinis]|uniref:NADH-quinone oxidoreductase subunit C n=1 Tax=unclassified Saccharicrinis TaxID=2646859 RepID=UPI003D330B5F